MSWDMSEDNRVLRERIAALEAENAALRSREAELLAANVALKARADNAIDENAALREDKARLDALWSLCRQHMYECGIGFFWDDEDGWFIAKVDHGDNGLTLSHGPNVDADIRAAIDAARKGGA